MGHAGENSTDYIATAAAKAARIAELDAEMTPSEIAAAIERLRVAHGGATMKLMDAGVRDFLVSAVTARRGKAYRPCRPDPRAARNCHRRRQAAGGKAQQLSRTPRGMAPVSRRAPDRPRS
jgi:hypothetical protein